MGKTGCWTFEKGHIWLEGLLRQEGQEEVQSWQGTSVCEFPGNEDESTNVVVTKVCDSENSSG